MSAVESLAAFEARMSPVAKAEWKRWDKAHYPPTKRLRIAKTFQKAYGAAKGATQ